jgi:hypothetical protein
MKHGLNPDIQIVPDDEDVDIARGEMVGYKVKDLADASTVPLAAYAASRPELPTWARVGLGLVAVTKAPAFLNRVKGWLRRD